ncbi:VanZ family protein [Paramicrobacterium agarici]|uniref:VanZ like protein n=1 Tax=Paramicrobacterium agarici TaxID=630514 RepID=A0A2A9DWN9_9MICO|nr:VanZ family protein [Microbacterium agarici]PFG31013.1 VanZ like protein [Microbacterium agarici]
MRHNRGMLRRRTLFGVLTLVYAMFIAAITLTPEPFGDGVEGTIDRALQALSQHPLTSWITYTLVEFVANIGMLVPFGLFVALCAGRRLWWVGAVASLAYTVFIESFQALVLSATRYATISDVIANSVGGLVGALVVYLAATATDARTRRRSASSTSGT